MTKVYLSALEKYFQPLNKQESKELVAKASFLSIFGDMLGPILVFGALLLSIGIYLFGTLGAIVIILVLLVFLSIPLYYAFLDQKSLRKDIILGYKVVYLGLIEKKREDSSSYNSNYYFTIIGQEFEVSFNQWERLKINQRIEIHFAPYSRYIFKLIDRNNDH